MQIDFKEYDDTKYEYIICIVNISKHWVKLNGKVST